jgi:hypothetical protein
MGKDFFRLVELALTSGALVIPGYAIAGDTSAGAPPDPPGVTAKPASATPSAPAPLVRSAQLDERGLTIQFSEPLRPATQVDPGKFRLTFAYYGKSRPGDYAYYYEYYGKSRDVTVYDDVSSKALGKRIAQPRPEQLRIPAAAGLQLSAVCDDLSTRKDAQGQAAGLFLHYDQGRGPRVESAKGAALESIAPYWVGSAEERVAPGALVGRPIPVAVACPPAAPKAPPRSR